MPSSGAWRSMNSVPRDQPTFVVWSIRFTFVLTGIIVKNSAMSSGNMRMQPCVTCMPTPAGRFVPWIRYEPPGIPSRKAYSPSGLSGPGGMNGGNGSPFASCSSRTDFGGYQLGRSCFDATLVAPSGVFQSILPVLIGYVRTTRGWPGCGGRIVVKAVLGQVDHDPLARRIRQQESAWNHHFGARPGQPGVDSGVRGDDFLVPDAITPADVEQRVLVLGHGDADRADHVVAIERQQEFACPDVIGDELCERCDQRRGEPLADTDILHATFLPLPASILATWRRSTRCSHALTRTRHRP